MCLEVENTLALDLCGHLEVHSEVPGRCFAVSWDAREEGGGVPGRAKIERKKNEIHRETNHAPMVT